MFTTNNYYYFPDSGDNKLLSKIFDQIKSINSKLEIMGEKLDAIKAELSAINESTNNIAADLDRLADQITGGLTAAEAESVVSELKSTSEQLKAIAAKNPETGEPTPPSV
jgi:chromosome segregation ATPase